MGARTSSRMRARLLMMSSTAGDLQPHLDTGVPEGELESQMPLSQMLPCAFESLDYLELPPSPKTSNNIGILDSPKEQMEFQSMLFEVLDCLRFPISRPPAKPKNLQTHWNMGPS